jgi:hypothetical protein
MAILMRIAREGLRVKRIFVTQLSLSGCQAGESRWACACRHRPPRRDWSLQSPSAEAERKDPTKLTCF